MNVNKVILIGRAGKTPDIRTFENGKMATFTLAVSETYTDRGGERRENTEWLNIVLSGRLADVAEKYIHKGSNVYIEGKIRTRSWDDQSGAKHYQTEIVGLGLQLLDPKQPAQTQAPQKAPASPYYNQQYPPSAQPPVVPPPIPEPSRQQAYGAVAQPPRMPQPTRQQELDPNNYPGDLPF